MSYETEQTAWIRRNNIKPGKKVQILHTARSYENGWSCSWWPTMNQYCGVIGTIVEIRPENIGIRINFGDGRDYRFPYFVLRRVKDEISIG